MPANTGIIEVETRLEADRSDVVVLIKDNGKGIEKKNLKNITTPFFTTKAKGTGLGLAICKQVVMLHKGTMRIESSPGKGTGVEITLPIHDKKNAEENSHRR